MILPNISMIVNLFEVKPVNFGAFKKKTIVQCTDTFCVENVFLIVLLLNLSIWPWNLVGSFVVTDVRQGDQFLERARYLRNFYISFRTNNQAGANNFVC